MAVSNPLTYYDTTTITFVKSLKVQSPESTFRIWTLHNAPLWAGSKNLPVMNINFASSSVAKKESLKLAYSTDPGEYL